jgi:hypothetical protein
LTISRHRSQFVALAVTAILVLALYWLWRSANGLPYLLHMKASENGAAVQFSMRDSGAGQARVSPIFKVPVSISSDSQITLTSPNVTIPQGLIEFSDTTTMPGRFRIRFGDVVLDVMEARIIADGVSHNWVPDDAGT